MQGITLDHPRKLSKFGKQLLTEALEGKIRDLRKASVPPPPSELEKPKPNPVPVKVKGMKVRSFEMDPSETGQVDFRKFLRKTNLGPKM
jgi:hypothetical protein